MANQTETTDSLISLIRTSGRKGTVSADITRLYRSSQYRLLVKLEKDGLLKSCATGRRDRGRRWFTPENYTEV